MRSIIPILLLSLALPAFAADKKLDDTATYETSLLKDWHGLIKVLRTRGIHNSQVEWHAIEELCLGLKNGKDHIPYNSCRLDKAVAQVSYRNDNIECNQAAKAEYPDRLLQYSPELLVTSNEGLFEGGDTEYAADQLYRAPMNKRELNNKRAVIYRSCMRDLGWRDPDNWRMGGKN
jgi:hypothetical protein